jgi:hypothetical protein
LSSGGGTAVGRPDEVAPAVGLRRSCPAGEFELLSILVGGSRGFSLRHGMEPTRAALRGMQATGVVRGCGGAHMGETLSRVRRGTSRGLTGS